MPPPPTSPPTADDLFLGIANICDESGADINIALFVTLAVLEHLQAGVCHAVDNMATRVLGDPQQPPAILPPSPPPHLPALIPLSPPPLMWRLQPLRLRPLSPPPHCHRVPASVRAVVWACSGIF